MKHTLLSVGLIILVGCGGSAEVEKAEPVRPEMDAPTAIVYDGLAANGADLTGFAVEGIEHKPGVSTRDLRPADKKGQTNGSSRFPSVYKVTAGGKTYQVDVTAIDKWGEDRTHQLGKIVELDD